MSTDVTLRLDKFGQRAFARLARGRRGSAAAAVRTASLYYLADRDSHRAAWRVPRFGLGEAGPTLKVHLDEETWRAVSDEAERQGVSPDALAVHAVMYFLADVDSGRMGRLLDEAFDKPE
ncbi:MAG TPA: hypothetical protein VH683_13550 [Thermoleophilaceae bacterium]|jgi:hypothetical protein